MFRFKRFSVDDDGCTMKVGTDAVLLACLAHSSTQFAEQRILDIGTGCGVIALITAQRFEKAQIVGIDIDEGSCLMAASNFEHSPWSHRLEARCGDVRNLAETEQYTMILSNPPYFHNSLKSSEKSRNLARHNDSLPIEHLLESAQRLLSPGGLLWTILPIAESSQLVAMGSDYNFLALEVIELCGKEGAQPIRQVVCQTKDHNAHIQLNRQRRTIRNRDNTYTDWYKQLTVDFYLWKGDN